MQKLSILFLVFTMCVLFFMLICTNNSRNIVAICDVGQGSAALISVGAIQLLVDTGPRYDLLVECLGQYLPYGDRLIESVVISHPDYDHYGALFRLSEQYRIASLFVNKKMYLSSNYSKLIESTSEKVNYLQQGDEIDFGKYKLKVEFPLLSRDDCTNIDDNNCSLVLTLCSELSDTCGLFAGDYPMQDLAFLQSDMVDRLIWIVVPHHGSDNKWSIQPLESMSKLKKAYISVGKDNSYGHPAVKVLDDLTKMNVSVYRTDLSGSMLIDI